MEIVGHLTAPGIFLLPEYSNIGSLIIRPEVEIVWGSVSLHPKDKGKRIERNKNGEEEEDQEERGRDKATVVESAGYSVANPPSSKRVRLTLKKN